MLLPTSRLHANPQDKILFAARTRNRMRTDPFRQPEHRLAIGTFPVPVCSDLLQTPKTLSHLLFDGTPYSFKPFVLPAALFQVARKNAEKGIQEQSEYDDLKHIGTYECIYDHKNKIHGEQKVK